MTGPGTKQDGSSTRLPASILGFPRCTDPTAERESRAELGNQLGQPVNSFAYPCTFPEANRAYYGRLRETLMASGYRSCVTTIASRVAKNDDAYTLRRLPMNGADDPALLLAKLEGAYDWMEPAQRSFKRVKRLVSRRSRRTQP